MTTNTRTLAPELPVDDATEFIPFSVIETRLAQLKGQLDMLDALSADLRGWHQWGDDIEGHWETHARRVLDELGALSTQVTHMRAHEYDQLRARAQQLLERSRFGADR